MDIFYFLAVLHMLYRTSNSQKPDILYILDKNDKKCTVMSHKYPERFLNDFTIISSNTSQAIDLQYIFYLCHFNYIAPSGKHIQDGSASFYFPRFRISALKCGQKLIVIGGHNSSSIFQNVVDDDMKSQFTCYNTPTIVNSKYRLLRLIWSFGNDVSSHVTIEFTNYVRFPKNYSIAQQRESCSYRQKFWCANRTNVCLSRQYVCNGLDYCFDGSSDESSCNVHPALGNNTASRISYSWSNWPWTALVILPIILVCALGRICSQKRQLDIDDDYEYKVSINQSDEHEEQNICDGRICENQIQETDGSGGFKQDFIETNPNGAANSVTSDYCVPDEKSDWKEDESSSDTSGACMADPHYLHVKDAVSNRNVNCIISRVKSSEESFCVDGSSFTARTQSQPVSSASNRLTNPVYGNNVYVMSPDVALAKPSRSQKQMAVRLHAPKSSSKIADDEEEFPPPPPPIVEEDYVAPGGPSGRFNLNAEVRDYQDLSAYTSLQLVAQHEVMNVQATSSTTCNRQEYDDESVIYAELLVPPQTSRPSNVCKKLPNCKFEPALHIEQFSSVSGSVHLVSSPVDGYGGAKPKVFASTTAAAVPSASVLKQSCSGNNTANHARPKYNVKIAEPHELQNCVMLQPTSKFSSDGSDTLERSNSEYDKHYIVV